MAIAPYSPRFYCGLRAHSGLRGTHPAGACAPEQLAALVLPPATTPFSPLLNAPAIPIFRSMWTYQKSARHQNAIDAMKPERDRAAAHAMAAELKLRREREAVQALKDHEEKRLATLAKTQRLRAARLALEAESPAKKPARTRAK